MPPVAMNFPGATRPGAGSVAAGVAGGAGTGFLAGGPAGAAIGAGVGLLNGLLGLFGANRAANAQSKAAGRAEKAASGDRLQQAMVDDYAMREDAARRTENNALRNGLLRSYGVTGLVDRPAEAPPNLLETYGKPSAGPMTLAAIGGLTRPAVPMAPPVAPPPQGRTLGSMFAPTVGAKQVTRHPRAF